MSTLYDFSATRLSGEPERLDVYTGQVVVVVNTASQCGFTPQLAELESLYQRFRDRGLVVLGFPCNQFAHQDPGTDAEIAEFCQVNYGISFPMFAKIDVNGPESHPVFAWMRVAESGLLGSAIKWNFTKFLIGRSGAVVRRYPSTTHPAAMTGDIEDALAAGTA